MILHVQCDYLLCRVTSCYAMLHFPSVNSITMLTISSVRLGYANAADVIEMKGRVACEISSGDELLLTELMFNGAFNDISVEQQVALLSCFVFQERVCDDDRLFQTRVTCVLHIVYISYVRVHKCIN